LGLEYRVWVLELRFRVKKLRFRVYGLDVGVSVVKINIIFFSYFKINLIFLINYLRGNLIGSRMRGEFKSSPYGVNLSFFHSYIFKPGLNFSWALCFTLR